MPMITPFNENIGQSYTEKNLMPGIAESAAGEEVSAGSNYAEDCAIAGATFPESPSSFASFADVC